MVYHPRTNENAVAPHVMFHTFFWFLTNVLNPSRAIACCSSEGILIIVTRVICSSICRCVVTVSFPSLMLRKRLTFMDEVADLE
jgi:hypothetical protein